jgi:Raf kinase inhibitor-like YbhB/YbcL family protein
VTTRLVSLLAIACLGLPACGSSGGGGAPTTTLPTTQEASVSSSEPTAQFTIDSPAFRDGAAIPTQFSCDGANVSPALRWTGVPPGTAALALVVDDPDAPRGTFTHWVVVDIGPSVNGSAEGKTPTGGREITNDTGKASYFGPCPPSGTHHYRFTLYALPHPLAVAAGAGLADVLTAIRSGAQASARLTGTYHR